MDKNISLYPEMDTFVDSSLIYSNYSGIRHYFVGFFKRSTVYRCLMKFCLKDIPAGAEIQKAVLRLYCSRNDLAGTECAFEIRPVIAPWKADTVNYSNHPPYDRGASSEFTTDHELFDFISVDITDFVRQWVQFPGLNHGIVIKAKNEKDQESLVTFASSRQGYCDLEPCLEIRYKPARPASPQRKKVAVLTPQFLETSGKRCLFGGGERYVIDLARLIGSMGHEVDIFQPSDGAEWVKEYDGLSIRGIGPGGFDEDFSVGLNTLFYEKTKQYDLHIYLNMDVIYPTVFPNSICISHGIWWDSGERPWWRTEKWYSRIFTGLDNIKTLVSVDTNTINWLRAVNPALRCSPVYIPNYVDLDIFKPIQTKKKQDPVRILFPRRLVEGRGWCVAKEVAKELTAESGNLVFSFVGRGTEEEEANMRALAARNKCIEYTWLDMKDMHKAYENADISLIPSYYTEGTSFSLLESMACGIPVIAGLAGGLTDLVIDGYNGRLIEVSRKTLRDAIVSLSSHRELREEMGRNAREVAKAFSKRIWEERWKKVLRDHLDLD